MNRSEKNWKLLQIRFQKCPEWNGNILKFDCDQKKTLSKSLLRSTTHRFESKFYLLNLIEIALHCLRKVFDHYDDEAKLFRNELFDQKKKKIK